jgi:hypothetical protein
MTPDSQLLVHCCGVLLSTTLLSSTILRMVPLLLAKLAKCILVLGCCVLALGWYARAPGCCITSVGNLVQSDPVFRKRSM